MEAEELSPGKKKKKQAKETINPAPMLSALDEINKNINVMKQASLQVKETIQRPT